HHPARKRVRLGVQVLLHHEQRRQHRHQDVERKERRLERAFDRSVVAPGTDRHPGRRGWVLPVDPGLTALREGRAPRSGTARLHPTSIVPRSKWLLGLRSGDLWFIVGESGYSE